MKTGTRDYTNLNTVALKCGLLPYSVNGDVIEGFYIRDGLKSPIDLTSCAEDEKSVLLTAVHQLTEQIQHLRDYIEISK